MNIAEILVTYSVSWWLILLMVLPFGNAVSVVQVAGQAASAPARPRIKRKMLWATALAFIPTLTLYFIQNHHLFSLRAV
jgi:predicted secreted protein